MTLALRPYQLDAIEASKTSQLQRQLIVLSTGMGKTITGLSLAREMSTRCLWLAHREELIHQPAKALQLVWPNATFGVVKAERNEYKKQVVFASVQSAQQQKRTEQLCGERFGLVVVDEAHHALSEGYRKLLRELGCWTEGGPRLVGLTATPERSDNGALEEVFQGIIYQVGITSAIEGGYLIPPTVIERPIKVDLDSVMVARGDFGAKQLDIALMQSGIVQEITDAYEEHCAGKRKTIIFVVSVAQAHAVADTLRERGHAVAALSGETPSEQRRSILRRLTTGELQCVVNCMVLTEGFDEPSVDAVLLARPTKSKPLMIQQVGRGLRLYPGKSSCLVIDMVGVSKRNTMVQAAVLFGIKPPEKNDVETKQMDLDPITDPEEYWRQRFEAQIKGVKGGPRSKLRWVPTDDSTGWLLPAGPEYGTVRLVAIDGEAWQVEAIGLRGDQSRIRLSDQPVSIEIAQAIAEDYIRRANAVRFASRNAPWRDTAATEAQIAMLERFNIKADGMTKGTANDLIMQHQAKRAIEPASSKQIHFLRRNGIRIDNNGITKRDASRLIAKLRNGTAQ